jgi:long-chain acyl-CoA synthetase
MATETASRARDERSTADGRTIARLWRDAVAAGRSAPAYLVETPEGWTEVSWAEAAQRVDDLANGLLSLGIRKGDAVAILAQTQLEWALADFALGLIGAIGAPIYANSAPRDCAYILEHSESVAVLVEDEAQRAKIESVRGDLPRLRHVIGFEELPALEADGRHYAHEHPDALAEAEASVGEDDLFTYIYTSGTTGPPKGCMIRHRNYYAMAACVDELGDFVVDGDVMLLYLPLAHNFGRLMHLEGPYVGYTLAFLSDPLRIGEAMPQVRPTVLPSVPRVYEKVYTAVKAQFDAATGVKRGLIDWAVGVGYRASAYKQRGERLPRGLALQHGLADRLVYSKVKEKLGGRLRIGISGGAPLAQEIAEFFHALDITLLEGYGLTECTTASHVNRPTRIRFGTVGPALPNVEVRIADDGEVLMRSPTVFAGYLKDEEATREVLDDEGWLHSGDVGEIDEDGFLRITDRKKDIIVTAGGKNVAPQNLENALKSSTLVSQALVIGDRRPYLTALITVDETAVAGRDDAAIEAEIQRIVDDVNRDLTRHEQIKRFRILPRDFTMEDGEVTPTLKLKRRVICERYGDEIEKLYGEPASAGGLDSPTEHGG